MLLVTALALNPWGSLRPLQAAAAATIAKVQGGTEATSSTGNLTLTLPAASTAGNLLVAMVANGGSTNLPFTTPSGWSLAKSTWNSSTGVLEIFYYQNNPGGISSVAFNSSSTSIGAWGQMTEWSGAATSGVLDQTGAGTSTSSLSATASTSGSTAVSGELGVTGFNISGSETSFTAGSGWTHLFSDPTNGEGSDYQLGLATGTASETETASSSAVSWEMLIVTFEPYPAPGAVGSLSATAGAEQATVSWTAPSSGGAVSYYVVTALYGGTTAENTTAVASTSATMTGLTGGTAYKFSVYAVGAGGSGASTTTASSVTPTATALPPYVAAVETDSPTFYYRMDETASTTLFDSSASTKTGATVGSPTQGSAGLLSTDSDTAMTFNGSSQYAYSSNSYANPTTFSIEAWFKTTTTTGGQIVGFGSAQTGNSGSHDRQLYMSNTGQLYFGVYTGSVVTINSTGSYNDGSAHHVVATLSSAGMFLYVDGAQVASSTSTTTAQNFTGYWRIGEDSLSGWTAAPTSYYFNGTIGQVAYYTSALSLQRVQVHECDGASVNCLAITTPSTITFPSLTIDDTTHTETATAALDVTDNSGGSGWNITATSTTLTNGTHTLSTTATTVQAAPTSACDSGWTCSAPTDSVSYPYTLPAAATAPAATKLVNAAVGSGQGHETVTVTFTLSIPPNVYAGTYSSTVTFTISSGP